MLAAQHDKHKAVPNALLRVAPLWVSTLRQRIHLWGEQDVRLFWLVLCAMQDANPAQGMTRDLSVVHSAIRQFVDRPMTARKEQSSRLTIFNKASNDESDPARQSKQDQLNVASKKHGPVPQSKTDQLKASGETEDSILQCKPEQLNTTSQKESPVLQSKPDQLNISSQKENPVLQNKPDQLNTSSQKENSVQENKPDQLNSIEASDDSLDLYQTKPDNDVRQDDNKYPQTLSVPEVVAGEEAKENDNYPATCLDYSKLQNTAFAGLPLIISLLQHLDIFNILDTQENAIQNNLPAHLLWSVVERFNLDKTDPAVAFIPDIFSLKPVTSFEFTAPASWMRMIQATPQTRLFVQQHDNVTRHVLTEQRNRIVLAIWYGQAPSTMTHWLAEASLQKTLDIEFTPDLQLVINSFHLMMGFYLRQSCAMSLRRLVHRAGRIATTNTHVDSVYTADKVDIHLRQAGLDTNPGWVPWLGKVVQHHYEYDDEHYF